ncbi:hypothetical protein ZEAMMB73_Zm00001d014490 [Zea mays]|uniref:Ubiquitin-like protease family profile domain-containing protein n=1 Tax=Zea mays TaxID=4577 RepID=A0A1D6GTQ3_MAIZE|nr:hypothetical protein ZEAMMB73_Zm00001d014490 [Zea mays]
MRAAAPISAMRAAASILTNMWDPRCRMRMSSAGSAVGRNKLMATHHYLDIMYLLNIQFNIQVVLDILATLNSSSCGLFLLNYIEYWTGDELSDSFTQDDMSHFRKKLAVILLSSCMNKRRGYPLCKYDKEVQTGSPSDVEILDSPTNHKKRKLLHMLDNSEVLMEDEDGPITQADLQRWFVDEWDKRTPTKVLTDGCTDDFLMSGLSTKDMPVTKADLIDVLCDYIMAIQDDTTLELNTSYLILQAMAMWGNDSRMKFVRDAKILRRNFIIELLSYEENSCRYAIPTNI